MWYRLRLLPGTDGATAVWNDEFQDVVEMAATTPQEVKNRSRSIKEIARTFADTAKVRPVGASVVHEQPLPQDVCCGCHLCVPHHSQSPPASFKSATPAVVLSTLAALLVASSTA